MKGFAKIKSGASSYWIMSEAITAMCEESGKVTVYVEGGPPEGLVLSGYVKDIMAALSFGAWQKPAGVPSEPTK